MAGAQIAPTSKLALRILALNMNVGSEPNQQNWKRVSSQYFFLANLIDLCFVMIIFIIIIMDNVLYVLYRQYNKYTRT